MLVRGSFYNPTGALGTVLIESTAPLPASEVYDAPIALIAIICANTLAPVGRLKGEAVSVVIGIEHVSADLIKSFAPLQLTVSCEYVTKSA